MVAVVYSSFRLFLSVRHMPPFSIESLELASKTGTSYDDSHIGSTRETLPPSTRGRAVSNRWVGHGTQSNHSDCSTRAESRSQPHTHICFSISILLADTLAFIHSLSTIHRKTSSIEYFNQQFTFDMSHTERVTEVM